MKHNDDTRARLILVFAMILYGTIGTIRRFIPLPSGFLAITRGYIGSLYLLAVAFFGRKHLSFRSLKGSLRYIILSGIATGMLWILLFEAYARTSISVAVLSYYMAPIFVILVSPLVLKERLTGLKLLCILAAFFGMVLVSDILRTGFSANKDLIGLLFGLGSAVFYAVNILCNKLAAGRAPAYEATIVQISIASTILIPYSLAKESLAGVVLTPRAALLTFVLGAVTTGLSSALFFMAMQHLNGQTIALYSYIDPIVAILLSAVILHESLNALQIVGAVLIFGSSFLCEQKAS